MVDWELSVELIGLPFSHWTHVTFNHPSRMGILVIYLMVACSQPASKQPAGEQAEDKNN